jgi:molybdopterin/thiamine biosynthesis adenylyltransferase
MTNDTLILEIDDENGVQHRITSRNLRAYKGREIRCACGDEFEIDEPPLVCPLRPNSAEDSKCDTSYVLVLDKNVWWNQPVLESSSVLLIGCGAVGNEVAKGLAMMGISKLTLIDFDELKDHNISRAVLFNQASEKSAKSNRKVDIMASGIHILNPNVEVVARPAGILDPISAKKRGVHANHKFNKEELSERMRWPEVIEKEELQELAQQHSICIIATDGVAPKASISKAIYPIIPIVQGAMNQTGSTVSVRTSMPGVTGCIMCPSELEPIGLDSNGIASPYYRRIREMTGAGGCDAFIEAAGAASFTDSTSMVGAAMVSQSILILMGWGEFKKSGLQKWPILAPLWDEVLMMSPRNPGNSTTYSSKIRRDAFNQPICSNSCSLDVKYDSVLENSPRGLALLNEEDGVAKPGSKKTRLGK